VFKFAARSLLTGIALALVVTAFTFSLVFSKGESIARQVLGTSASADQVEIKIGELGLDDPLPAQYLDWLVHALRGDFGNSFYSGEPVAQMLAVRVEVTLSIVLIAFVMTAVLSVAVGVLAAVRGGWVDRALQFVAVLGAAIPQFILAIALAYVFAIHLRVLPATGYVSARDDIGGWLATLILPVTAILVGSVAGAAQQFRGAMLDALEKEYINTLRARGISEFTVVTRHALRNAAAPGMTVLSLQTIALLGGVVLIERIFALPGIGTLATESAFRGDLPVVLGTVTFTVAVVVVINFAASMMLGWLNPKVRLS